MEASDWMKQNSLKINENKTEFIIFRDTMFSDNV